MNKSILRLAIPNIISNLTVPLLGSVDTALVGHLSQVYYLGAIAVGGMIFNFIYWSFGFLRMGTTGLTAQAFGNENVSESILILIRALMVSLAIGLILIILQRPIAWLSFNLLHATPEVEYHARVYFFIRIFAAPATLSLYSLQGWFLGMQNAKLPLILAVFINVMNIIFDVIFIKYFGMNSAGVAFGTLVAQYSGLVLAVFLFHKNYNRLTQKIEYSRILDLTALKKFFSVNRDIFIRTLFLIFTFSYFTAKSAEFGDDILAVNTILLQLWMIFSYGIDGFAFAAESLIGRFMGSGNREQLRFAVRRIFAWGIGMGIIFMMVYLLFGKQIISLFTNKIYLVDLAMIYLGWTIFAPFLNSFSYIWDGIYIGATASAAMRNSMMLSTFLVFLPVWFLTGNDIGNHGLWLAMVSFMVTRAISLTFMAKRHIFDQLA
ncbi:MAG: MATE family efflux transporter [Calditrichaceae bacterium]